VIKFTSCLPRVGGSLRVLRLPPPLKTGRHDIAEILLKVALNHNQPIYSTNINKAKESLNSDVIYSTNIHKMNNMFNDASNTVEFQSIFLSLMPKECISF
jgi:hypothetical protein